MASGLGPDGAGSGADVDKSGIRDAATVILVRDPATAPKVLMGQRGAQAAFMPNKFVFPGGAMDAGDGAVPMAAELPEPCAARLGEAAAPGLAAGLAAAAIRELWEETGLRICAPGAWPGGAPGDWQGFAAAGDLPDPRPLSFVFRAITPPGRSRRFDARFFLAGADAVAGDPDVFDAASDELSHLQWIPLTRIRDFHLPFITKIALAEVAAALPGLGPPPSVPFFDIRGGKSLFRRLGGRPSRSSQA